VVNAVLAAGADDVTDALAAPKPSVQRVPRKTLKAISTSFKRMKNILRQASAAGKLPAKQFEPANLPEAAERALAEQMAIRVNRDGTASQSCTLPQCARGNFQASPGDRYFFDKVMVMVRR